MNWFTDAKNEVTHTVTGWLSNEDKHLLEFFAPLLSQVKATALQLGKDDLEAGLKVLKDAAIASAIAAATAPAGAKVSVAEATFLKVLVSEGIEAIHNAEAASIKAAVAIIQTQTPVTISSALSILPALAPPAANTK